MTRDSKYLSRILRHEPELIDIQLDPQGWVRVDELLRALKKVGRGLSRAQLIEIVETNDKQRFTLSPNGRCICPVQGHSIDIGLSPIVPPACSIMEQRRRISTGSSRAASTPVVGVRFTSPLIMRLLFGSADGTASLSFYASMPKRCI